MDALHERGETASAATSSSSSRSSSFQWTYDVFVSYRGGDSKNFSGYLINNLRQKGLTVFRDDEFERGEFLGPAFDSAIEGARASLIVFSENYADSKWCLNELVKIMECRDLNRQLVRSIFYKVDPSVVRNQREKYGEAMAAHEIRFSDQLEKVHKWREALRTAANLSGWGFHGGYEPDFVQQITKEISTQIVNRASLHIADHQVGLTARVSELNTILDAAVDRNDVRLVVVHGPKGIGKTTLVKAAYNSNVNRFEGSSFLANVSENSNHDAGILQLQKTLLHEVLRERYLMVGNVHKGINLISKRLRNKRVLLVLDDVNSLKELQSLAHSSDWFGKGSRIIVTTRDKNELDFLDFSSRFTYEVKKLDDGEALKLLCWNAFRNEEATDGYLELAEQAVQYADGFPLKLVEMGSYLHGKLKDEWKIALESYRRKQYQRAKGKDVVSFPEHHNHQSWEESDLLPSTTRSSMCMENSHLFQHQILKNENLLVSRDNNGKSHCMLSAKELSIDWSHESQYWSWISLPDSRFSQVAKLNKVYFLNIEGKIETTCLSPRTTYAIYFVFKLEGTTYGFKERAINFTVSSNGPITFFNLPKNAPQLCQKREDGWMEFVMGEFFIDDEDNYVIQFCLREHDDSVKKSGLVIEGVDFRPKAMENENKRDDHHNIDKQKVNLELDLSSSSSIENCVFLTGYSKLKLENEDMITSQDNSRKICYMVSARELKIEWSEQSKHWRWIPNSRFSKVAKLKEVYFLDIKGKMETRNLSSRTKYTVFFVYKFESTICGFKNRGLTMKVKCEKCEGGGDQIVVLDPSKNSGRDDGWMEMKMGEFFIDNDDNSEIKFCLKDHDTSVMKSGLVVAGVEFRPK